VKRQYEVDKGARAPFVGYQVLVSSVYGTSSNTRRASCCQPSLQDHVDMPECCHAAAGLCTCVDPVTWVGTGSRGHARMLPRSSRALYVCGSHLLGWDRFTWACRPMLHPVQYRGTLWGGPMSIPGKGTGGGVLLRRSCGPAAGLFFDHIEFGWVCTLNCS
jgi:hypothetical protein